MESLQSFFHTKYFFMSFSESSSKSKAGAESEIRLAARNDHSAENSGVRKQRDGATAGMQSRRPRRHIL